MKESKIDRTQKEKHKSNNESVAGPVLNFCIIRIFLWKTQQGKKAKMNH